MAAKTTGAPPLRTFTEDQRHHIQSQLPLFSDYLKDNNPTVTHRHQGTSSWISATAKEIISHELFEIGNLGGKSPSKVETDIRTFFRNWKNNTYKKALGIGSSSPTTAPSPSTSTTRALDDAIRGLVILEGDLSAREIFLRQRPEEYSRAYKSVKSDMPPGSASCAIAQKAMKRAWDQADHGFWEKRKRDLELDVGRNQVVWPEYLRDAVQQNLDRGIIGSAVVGIMYAVRTESEGLQHGILYAGYDAAKQEEIKHMPKAHDEILKHFIDHADIYLPPIRQPSIFQFERDESGFPLLPLLDINDVSLGKISEVLRLYLALLWDHAYPADNAMPSIPWLALAQDPAGHYAVNAYSLPCSIGSPAPCKPIDAPSLYVAIYGYQGSATPFCFFSKEEYLTRARAAAQRLVDHAEAGEEIDRDAVTRKGTDEARATPAPSPSPMRQPSTPPPATPPPSTPPPVTPPPSTPPPSTPPPSTPPPSTPPPATPPPATPPPVTPPPVPSPPVSPIPPAKDKRQRKGKKSLGDSTNTSTGTGAEPPRRGSTRNRKTAEFGLQLVAGGMRSPPGRKSTWEYTESDRENQGPPKRQRRR